MRSEQSEQAEGHESTEPEPNVCHMTGILRCSHWQMRSCCCLLRHSSAVNEVVIWLTDAVHCLSSTNACCERCHKHVWQSAHQRNTTIGHTIGPALALRSRPTQQSPVLHSASTITSITHHECPCAALPKIYAAAHHLSRMPLLYAWPAGAMGRPYMRSKCTCTLRSHA